MTRRVLTTLLCFCIVGNVAMTAVQYTLKSVKISSTGTFDISVRRSGDNNSPPNLYFELSLFSDFSRIHKYYKRTSPTNPSISADPASAFKGKYYWRLNDNGTYYQLDTNSYEFGNNIREYTQVTDPTEYNEVTLNDGTIISLRSIWFRSHSNGNGIYSSIDMPYSSDKNNMGTLTSNHGAVVKGNTIYISRGSSNHISGWVSNRTRMWLERYDLATGLEQSMLWIYAPDENEFPHTADNPNGLHWIRTDDDGLAYFTISGKVMGSSDNRHNTLYLYSVDLDDVTENTESIVARLEKTFTHTELHNPFYVTVEGSIRKGNYTLWANSSKGHINLDKEYETLGIPVLRFSVTPGNEPKAEISYIRNMASLKEEHFGKPMSNVRGKITPADEDYFYFQCSDGSEITPSPMLYQFNPDGDCEAKSSFRDCMSIVTPHGYPPVGMDYFTIGDNHILAYGIRSTSNTGATMVNLVETPSLASTFDRHRLLYRLGEKTGIATYPRQGLMMTYIPDETTERSNKTTGGRLLMHVGNGGTALYRIDVKSSDTSHLDSVTCPVQFLGYTDGAISFSSSVDGITIHDMQGRIRYSNTRQDSRFHIGDRLSGGLYLIRFEGRVHKLLVR